MYTTTDFLTAVQRRAAIPKNQGTFADSDIFSLGDEEIASKLLPLILSQMEEFYVRQSNSNITADKSSYLIPTRAIAASLRDVEIVDSTDSQTRTPLERLNREDLYALVSQGRGYGTRIRKVGFYPQGNSIIVYPTPTITQNILCQTYYCRPNRLVAVDECGLIESIDTVAKTITVTNLPAAFSVNGTFDFVKANPHFECSAIDQTPTNLATNTFTFSSALPADLAVGDYLCLAGQTCVVQVPAELQPLLIQYVTVRVLSAQSDSEPFKLAMQELTILEKAAAKLIAPRIAGKAKRVSNSAPLTRMV